jgi:hypothetical protein
MTTDTATTPVLLQLRPVYVAGAAGTVSYNGTCIIESESALMRQIRQETEAGRGHLVPLMMWAVQRRRTVALLQAGTDFPLHKVSPFANACLVLPGHGGPNAWGQLPQLVKWAQRVVLHDRKPAADDYS